MQISFPMYPSNAAFEQVFWLGLKKWLHHFGVSHTPQELSHPLDLHEHWAAPDVLLSQTCGYPLVTELEGKVRIVGAFSYDAAGCEDIFYRSFLIARADDDLNELSDFRHRTVAFNSINSQSGYNCLRAQITPFAVNGRFFGRALASGAHLHSIQMVASGEADIAAIDCVSYAFFKDLHPDLLTKVKVIGQTPLTPGLPLITNAATTDNDLHQIQKALTAAMNDDSLADARSALRIKDFCPIKLSAYDVCLDMQRAAAAVGVHDL
jgi:ABC-type phosphate/phosphonate transport system substrate-binding protein